MVVADGEKDDGGSRVLRGLYAFVGTNWCEDGDGGGSSAMTFIVVPLLLLFFFGDETIVGDMGEADEELDK